MTRYVFSTHDSDVRAPIGDAYLVGKDARPFPGQLESEDGAILALLPSTEVCSLVVEHSTPQGCLMLQTCLLPGGERTYLLPLELARHRIMMLIRKLEEWALSHLEPSSKVMQLFDASRARFTEALVAGRTDQDTYSSEAIAAAEESLALAVDAGEHLARIDAQQHRHATAAAVASPQRIGCVVQPDTFNSSQQQAIAGKFDFVTCPLHWNHLEPEEGRYTFTPTDRCIEWGVRTCSPPIPIVAGPIVDFAPSSMPDWLGIWEHDYEQLRDFAYAHVKRVVTRYRRTVSTWIAASGLSENAGVALSLEQMVDLTRLVTLATRKLHPNAAVLVEIAHPFGDRLNVNKPGIPPRLFAELLVEAGIRMDGIALRLQMGEPSAGRRRRDLLTIAHTLDHFAVLERPIHITGLGMPSRGTKDASLSPQSQAEWVQQVMSIVAARPYIRSICWQGLADSTSPAYLEHGGLIDTNGQSKPALDVLSGARQSPSAPAAT